MSRAKGLSDKQVDVALAYIASRPNPTRNRVMFLLSVKAGLRAVEISRIPWRMALASDGSIDDELVLEAWMTKGGTGERTVPMHRLLRSSLSEWNTECVPHRDAKVVPLVRGVVVNWFWGLYRDLGYIGCSSHSGRRTFITSTGRKISLVGGSLRDVQLMAGHKSLSTTQTYIDSSEEAKRKVVDLL